MILMLDAFRRHLTPEIKVTVNSIITGLVISPDVKASQLQLWHVVVNKLYIDHPKQLYGAVWEGGMLCFKLDVQEAQCDCCVSGF
jgi:hypothetical protein